MRNGSQRLPGSEIDILGVARRGFVFEAFFPPRITMVMISGPLPVTGAVFTDEFIATASPYLEGAGIEDV